MLRRGLTYTDRFNAPRKRSEVSVAESATIAFARLTRELDLDCGSRATSAPPLPFNLTGAINGIKKRLDKRRSAVSETEAAWLRGDRNCCFIQF
jgi:hypothetical protein